MRVFYALFVNQKVNDEGDAFFFISLTCSWIWALRYPQKDEDWPKNQENNFDWPLENSGI